MKEGEKMDKGERGAPAPHGADDSTGLNVCVDSTGMSLMSIWLTS